MRKILPLLLILAACEEKPAPEPTVKETPIDQETAGTIKGKVRFDGTPPANLKLPVGGNAECSALHAGPAFDEAVLVKNGRLQNALVYVKSGLEKHVFAWPKEPVTILNEKCVYIPRISGAMTNQTIEFGNNDPTAHNIHGYSSQGDFNFTLIGKGVTNTVKLKRPEMVLNVKCDLHPWMKGSVGIFSHPFFRVTGPDGEFELKGLPPGDYEIEAWHERFGVKSLRAKLEPKGSADLEFVYTN